MAARSTEGGLITVAGAFGCKILRRALTPAALTAVVLLVGGCGGGGTADTEAVPAISTKAPSTGVVLAFTGHEYSFTPTTTKASPGETTIRFTNKGAMEHDLTIAALGVHLTAQPGKTAEATVTLRPGTYTSICSVPGHVQSGMQGTFTVS